MLGDDVGGATSLKHLLAAQQPVANAGERVNVGALSDAGATPGHLGRQVGGSARRVPQPRSSLLSAVVPPYLHEAEVEDFDKVEVPSHVAGEEVRRFDVAVDEAVLVCVCE